MCPIAFVNLYAYFIFTAGRYPKINKDNLCGLLIIFQNYQSQLYIQQKDWQEAINFSMASLLAKN